MLDEYGMKLSTSTRHMNLFSGSLRRASTKKTHSGSYISKGVPTDEMIEHCRANAVNYYVCYGSAVVSVRNAERERRDSERWKSTVFDSDECKSQDIIVDMATWLLLDSDSVTESE